MKKEEIIARYGEGEYGRRLEQSRQWREANPDKMVEHNRNKNCKEGKFYKKALKTSQAGVPGEKRTIRSKHRYQYKPFKDIIAPDSQIHHEWVPKTSEYRGVALVEKDQHQYGFVDVIQILKGDITLSTEEEIRNREVIEK